jgi:hypothetical protein
MMPASALQQEQYFDVFQYVNVLTGHVLTLLTPVNVVDDNYLYKLFSLSYVSLFLIM